MEWDFHCINNDQLPRWVSPLSQQDQNRNSRGKNHFGRFGIIAHFVEPTISPHERRYQNLVGS
jgi:hypothetical protein